MNIIETNRLEIFKTNRYLPTDLGMVSDNAYLSIVATNNCQCDCPYCINSETDRRLNLPIEKAIRNIQTLVIKYKVKEAIILGGEPLLHQNIIELVKQLRTNTGLKMVRLTTNGIYLKQHPEIIQPLFNQETGLQGINISHHNEKDFMTYDELKTVCTNIKQANNNIKIRINSNIWKNNLDNIQSLLNHISRISDFADEIRISNIIFKDDFSVNNKNNPTTKDLILSNEEYENIFTELLNSYPHLTIFDNKKTLGFVRYLLIPTRVPIIVNWNIGSTVSEQVCENQGTYGHINTFKCLVDGSISLSWNKNNVIIK